MVFGLVVSIFGNVVWPFVRLRGAYLKGLEVLEDLGGLISSGEEIMRECPPRTSSIVSCAMVVPLPKRRRLKASQAGIHWWPRLTVLALVMSSQ